MNKVLGFDPAGRLLRCQPGVVVAEVAARAEAKGLYYPVDFASAGSAQLGGSVATNAGGIKVIRYGMTRQWVAGLRGNGWGGGARAGPGPGEGQHRL